ncbi:MAG: hypothetical protein ABSB40_11575 [Nitrososphaeria archaeon]|jgi:NDP-sugar pyrophosphorylase family protein
MESLKRRAEIMQNVRDGKVNLDGAVLVGRDCHISTSAMTKDSCINNFCKIGKNIVIEKSAIMNRAIIGDRAEIRDSIIGRHVKIMSSLESPNCISGVSVIGDDAILRKGCEIVSTKIS